MRGDAVRGDAVRGGAQSVPLRRREWRQIVRAFLWKGNAPADLIHRLSQYVTGLNAIRKRLRISPLELSRVRVAYRLSAGKATKPRVALTRQSQPLTFTLTR